MMIHGDIGGNAEAYVWYLEDVARVTQTQKNSWPGKDRVAQQNRDPGLT